MRSQLKSTHIAASSGGNGSKPVGFSRTETFTELSTTKMTSVVCTPYRTVEILETADGLFSLRETTWQGTHSACAHIWLKPYELVALKQALARIEIVESGRPA